MILKVYKKYINSLKSNMIYKYILKKLLFMYSYLYKTNISYVDINIVSMIFNLSILTNKSNIDIHADIRENNSIRSVNIDMGDYNCIIKENMYNTYSISINYNINDYIQIINNYCMSCENTNILTCNDIFKYNLKHNNYILSLQINRELMYILRMILK